jgi:hypothetical protein
MWCRVCVEERIANFAKARSFLYREARIAELERFKYYYRKYCSHWPGVEVNSNNRFSSEWSEKVAGLAECIHTQTSTITERRLIGWICSGDGNRWNINFSKWFLRRRRRRQGTEIMRWETSGRGRMIADWFSVKVSLYPGDRSVLLSRGLVFYPSHCILLCLSKNKYTYRKRALREHRACRNHTRIIS